MKRLAMALLILVFGVTCVLAAPATTATGKVLSIDGKKVQITLTGAAPDWAKKGSGIKITGVGSGKILEVSGTALTFQSPKASALKVGQEITFEKGPVLQGC